MSDSRFSIIRHLRKNDICNGGCQEIDKTIVVLPGCADDTAAVTNLPDDWTPRHSGTTLANYLKQREQKHDKLQQELTAECCRVNKDVDDKLRELAEILLAHIEDNQNKIDCSIQKCGTGKEMFTPEQRNEALKVIHILYNNRMEDITDFIQNALNLERERADKLRHLMRDQFQSLVAVGHKSPKDLLHDFDDRIYDVNQQLLSNNRAYGELTAELQAEAGENVVKARSTLNQLCLGVTTAYRCQSARQTLSRGIFLKRCSSASDDQKYSESIIKKAITQEEVDKCVMQLLKAYRQAVLDAFTGFSTKLQDLQRSLTDYNCEQIAKCNPNCIELQDAIESALGFFATKFHTNISVSIFNRSHELKKLTKYQLKSIQSSLASLGECLWDTYTILHEAGHLWDAHMLRSALAQKLTIAAVEDLITRNDSVELANEITINQVLEKMVTSPDEAKLKHFYAHLMMILDNATKMYKEHCDAEISRLDEFMKLPTEMANTLLAEFKCFLAKHPRPKNLLEHKALNDEDILQELSLPHLLTQTEHQIKALMNWRNGFLETFKNNICKVPDELIHQAQLWVNERSAALHMRHSLKQVSHNVRKERVKAAYESRLAELRHHEGQLESHLNAIKELVLTLPEEASHFSSLDAPELYPLRDWVRYIDEDFQKVLNDPNMNPENKELKMKSYVHRLPRYKKLFENSLLELFHEYETKILEKISNARISNVRFIGSLKLFFEGGRYAPQEVITASAGLLKTDELLDFCESRSSDALNSRKVQLLALAEQEIILPVQQNIFEFLKKNKKHL